MRTSAGRTRALRVGTAMAAALWLAAAPCVAAEDELLERIEQLELRIRDLEANQVRPVEPPRGGGGDWASLLRIGGSANAGYFGGQEESEFDPDAFRIRDARLFVDAELGERVVLGESTIFRNVGLSFEWDLVRIGNLQNDVGELYVDFQGVLGQDAFNFQVGRFQIPVGEAYLRYSRGHASKPFVSSPVGGPWWWDEGVRFYGSDPEGRFGYVASVSNGDTDFNSEAGAGEQGTLRLFARPLPWLYASASALRSGKLGSSASPANGALWLGESWARAFGAGTGVDSYQDGVIVPDGPNELHGTTLLAGDLIFDFHDRVRVWLAYGRYDIDSQGGSFYDRVLHYWIAEAVLRGGWLSQALRPFYVGVRASGLGTYDSDEGYLLDVRRGSTLGYNMQSVEAYATVLGWELNRYLTLRAEYTYHDIDLVKGTPASIRAEARDSDFFAIEAGASF